MPRKLAIKRCDPYYGLTVEQVKKYLARRSAGRAHRLRFLRQATFHQSGKSVHAQTKDPLHWQEQETTLYRCENGRIVGYSDYRGSLR